MKVLIIIPAYNEQDNIERVVKHLTENYPEYDYVVINDGSMDKTSEICHSNHYNIIDLPVNLGLAGGFQTGMKYAYQKGYDCAVQFDADGQHRPEYIAAMIRKIEEGNDDKQQQRPSTFLLLSCGDIAVGGYSPREWTSLSIRMQEICKTYKIQSWKIGTCMDTSSSSMRTAVNCGYCLVRANIERRV